MLFTSSYKPPPPNVKNVECGGGWKRWTRNLILCPQQIVLFSYRNWRAKVTKDFYLLSRRARIRIPKKKWCLHLMVPPMKGLWRWRLNRLPFPLEKKMNGNEAWFTCHIFCWAPFIVFTRRTVSSTALPLLQWLVNGPWNFFLPSIRPVFTKDKKEDVECWWRKKEPILRRL